MTEAVMASVERAFDDELKGRERQVLVVGTLPDAVVAAIAAAT